MATEFRNALFRRAPALLALTLAGCANVNTPAATRPGAPAGHAGGVAGKAPAPCEPRLLWRSRQMWLVGLNKVPGKGALFSVLEAPHGRVIGVVQVVEQAGGPDAPSRVEWYCWQQREPQGGVSDWLPVHGVERFALDVGKCLGDYYFAGQLPGASTPYVVLKLGSNQDVVIGDEYDLAPEHGDTIGQCRVRSVDRERSTCEVERGAPLLGSRILQGRAHVRMLLPGVDELKGWVQPYAGEWPPPATATGVCSGSDDDGILETDRWLAIGAWGVGAIGIGVGTAIAADAKSDYDTALESCGPGGCPDAPYGEVQSARRRGRAATGFIGVGTAVAGAGFVFWFARPVATKTRGSQGGLRIDGAGIAGDQAVLWGAF